MPFIFVKNKNLHLRNTKCKKSEKFISHVCNMHYYCQNCHV
nr:MAG TPA: hypothetical protein [Caudoviricetes sp.]